MGEWQRATRSCGWRAASKRPCWGRRSRQARRTRAAKRSGSNRLDGLTLETVAAHGKHLLLGFGELSLHSHLGMSGGWHFYRPGARWRRPRTSAWAVLSGGGWDAVQFGGPTLQVATTARLRRDPQLTRLGPDILADELRPRGGDRRRSAPTRPAASATPCSTSTWSPGSATSSRARPASPPGSTPGGRSARSPTRSWSPSSTPPVSRCWRRSRAGGATASASTNAARAPVPVCRGPISSRGQGDANRTTYWCPRCQS